MGVDRFPLGPECRLKDGSRRPGLAFAHEGGTLVRHPARADRIQGGAADRRTDASEADPDPVRRSTIHAEEITLDNMSPIQGGGSSRVVKPLADGVGHTLFCRRRT
jgi:hypothetical protein